MHMRGDGGHGEKNATSIETSSVVSSYYTVMQLGTRAMDVFVPTASQDAEDCCITFPCIPGLCKAVDIIVFASPQKRDGRRW